MKILIGTKNPEKIEGAKRAFEKYFKDIEIQGISVPSEVGDEPINEKILQGAKNRIKNLKKYAKENNIEADYFVATEGGMTNTLGNWINLNTAAIENKNGFQSVGISQGLQIPDRYIEEIKKSELNDLKNRIFCSEEFKGKDFDSIVTHDILSRTEAITNAFIMALVGHINGEIWQ